MPARRVDGRVAAVRSGTSTFAYSRAGSSSAAARRRASCRAPRRWGNRPLQRRAGRCSQLGSSRISSSDLATTARSCQRSYHLVPRSDLRAHRIVLLVRSGLATARRPEVCQTGHVDDPQAQARLIEARRRRAPGARASSMLPVCAPSPPSSSPCCSRRARRSLRPCPRLRPRRGRSSSPPRRSRSRAPPSSRRSAIRGGRDPRSRARSS